MSNAARGTFEELLNGTTPELADIACRYAYIMPMRGYVNLGFYQGAYLEDAQLEGTGKGLRHVKIRSLDEASNPALRGLLAAALAARKRGRDPDVQTSERRMRR